MNAYDILAIGEPLFEFAQQEDGRYVSGFGGDTSNVLIAASRLGARCAYASAVGTDPFGDAFIELWTSEGIDCRYVHRRTDAPTGGYIITRTDRGTTFTYLRRGSAASLVNPSDVPDDTIQSARYVHASGISLAISSSAADTVFSAFDRARRLGVRRSLDTNLRLKLWPLARARALIHAAAEGVDVLKTSLDDAELLCGHSAPVDIARYYLDLGARLVAVTLGSRGALIAGDHGVIEAPPVPVLSVDATGAGDAFMGALLTALANGVPAAEALSHANAAGACSTRKIGAIAGLPRLEEVAALEGSGGIR